ncbi:MAG: hypothetical protein KJ042_15940 [Deltaproteobacteria bacterium]|nr:hypothetical protein [Deltaproteobacteria bacterium]
MRQRSVERFGLVWILLVAFISAVGACGGGGGGDDPSTGSGSADDDAAGDDEDDETPLTYENFAKDFFGDYCLHCHVAPLDEDVPFVLDTYDAVVEQLDEIRIQAVELKAMPPEETPGDFPTDAEREKLGEWIDAGAPE